MKKLAHKLILGMLLFTMLTTGVIWFYQSIFLEKQYFETKKNELIKDLRTIKETIIKDNEINTAELIDTLAYTYDHLQNLELYNTRGTLVYATGGMMGRGHLVGMRLLRGEALATLRSKGELFTIAPLSRDNTDTMVYALQIEDVGILVGTHALEPITETVALLRQQLIWLTGLFFILALFLGSLVATTIIRPIQHLKESVVALSHGDLGIRARVEGHDELAELAISFNDMAKSLGRIDALRTELIANVSHEFRTPLGIIRGYSEVLMDISGDNPVERQKHLSSIIEETEHLNALVSTLLDLSQLQAKVSTLTFHTIDLAVLAQSTLEKYNLVVDNHAIQLKLYTQTPPYFIEGDEKRIVQILSNFLDNAIKHTPPNGVIDIVLEKKVFNHHEGIELSVTDYGPGMDETTRSRVWERFFTASQSGSGLGLAIVKQICDAHGASYGVDSQLGNGSRFWVFFPSHRV